MAEEIKNENNTNTATPGATQEQPKPAPEAAPNAGEKPAAEETKDPGIFQSYAGGVGINISNIMMKAEENWNAGNKVKATAMSAVLLPLSVLGAPFVSAFFMDEYDKLKKTYDSYTKVEQDSVPWYYKPENVVKIGVASAAITALYIAGCVALRRR